MGKTMLMEKMWINSLYGSFGGAGDSGPMLYRAAFAEQTKRKKKNPEAEHKIVKINKSQFKVVTSFKLSPMRFIDQESKDNAFIVDYASDLLHKPVHDTEAMKKLVDEMKVWGKKV